MTDFAIGLMVLYPGQNTTPKAADGPYQAIVDTWRGPLPIPSEAEIDAAAQQWYAENPPFVP